MPGCVKPAGFSLIECLVAILILSVGMLATSKMVNNSLQFTDSAALRTQSVPLAYELAAKIRANESSALQYGVDIGEEVGAVNCNQAACTVEQLAQSDLSEWKANLASSLPLGDGGAVVSATGATITVQWSDRGLVSTYVLEVSL